jgi:hypothetical protein
LHVHGLCKDRGRQHQDRAGGQAVALRIERRMIVLLPLVDIVLWLTES